jgi:alpha-glucosidase (family GH31 glycosyl hydrolase)
MEHFKLQFQPVAHPDAVVEVGQARFTVLTSRMIRMEYQIEGVFEDRASQPIWYRNQPVPQFDVRRDDSHIEIETEYLLLRYVFSDLGFSPTTLSIRLKELDTVWRAGDANPENLLGTARTLDDVSGHVTLQPGLLSRSGWSLVNDSETLVFDANGWLENRTSGGLDWYFLGYGTDYQASLSDYFKIAGRIPLLPRWVLGNWWSRYWAYSHQELTDLMREFVAHEIPLAVCIIDMDWHITKTGNESNGWTGYTWNRELFPEPEQTIAFLHELGLRTALNLHPALGVYPHEEQYPAMAKRLGVSDGQPVKFDIASPVFAQAYFELLHHPLEAQGIDFWWMDWQQGEFTTKRGLDPLWWLNHLHFYDLGRTGDRRTFVFSRWGGLGNHRYPIGFSGDTHVTWSSLAYQPYFTSTAANVGYAWWSHDIGGHTFGIEEPELYLRWVQFGVFSPIFRLHSTKNHFHERLPWKYDAEVGGLAADMMRLRHQLIPYLYSMSWRAATEDLQPIRPMYHQYAEYEQAYHCPNQYTFGSELIAAPQISPMNPDLRLSRQVLWMPPGDWFDFFSGQRYAGDRWQAIYSKMSEVPVFAKAGAIVPLASKAAWGGVDNPESFELYLFPGADNRFDLFEDDGDSMHYLNGEYCTTTFESQWKRRQWTFTIHPAKGQTQHLPAQRSYTLYLRGIVMPEKIELQLNGETTVIEEFHYDEANETVVLPIFQFAPDQSLTVTVSHSSDLMATRDRLLETCQKMISIFRLESWTKNYVYELLPQLIKDRDRFDEIAALVKQSHLLALLEVVMEAGMTRINNASHEHKPLILWNNRESEEITYRMYERHGWSYASLHNVVPKSKIIETYGLQHWKVEFAYGDLMIHRSKSEDELH